MSEQPDPEALMELAEAFQNVVKSYSDVLRGAVSTLVEEGWTEAEAREIALLAWKQAASQ